MLHSAIKAGEGQEKEGFRYEIVCSPKKMLSVLRPCFPPENKCLTTIILPSEVITATVPDKSSLRKHSEIYEIESLTFSVTSMCNKIKKVRKAYQRPLKTKNNTPLHLIWTSDNKSWQPALKFHFPQICTAAYKHEHYKSKLQFRVRFPSHY